MTAILPAVIVAQASLEECVKSTMMTVHQILVIKEASVWME